MKKVDRSFRTGMALFICFISVLLAIAPAVSYIAGTPDSLMSYATDSENDAEDTNITDDAENNGGTKAADEEKAPAETVKEDTGKDTPKKESVTDEKGSSDGKGYPAVELSQTAGGVEISLSAGKGVFPEGVTLSASRVKGAELKKVDKALESERGDSSTVDSSYTFDIKVLDKNGNEVQPADGKNVSLSFAAAKVADKNYSTRVYHIEDGKKELDATELKVTTDGDAATVRTDGFSYYTVEFTYGDKQYVLEGDGVVKLDDLLKEIGIEGEVKGVSVSDPELFGVIRGTKKGVSYTTRFENGKTKKVPTNDPKGTVRYVASYKPFDTEEWMDITMKDGKKYHVIVTDALMGDNTIDKNIPGVFQGTGSEFAETIPVATIWIDDSIFKETTESRRVGDHGSWSLSFIPGALMNNQENPENIGFQVEKLADDGSQKGSAQYYGNHFVIYDSGKMTLNDQIETKTNSGEKAYQSCNEFNGVVGTYKYSNAAVYTDANGKEQKADVYIEYSDPMISIETPTDAAEASEWNDVKVGLFGPNIITNGKNRDNGQRYALDITVKPYVRTHSDEEGIGGEPIEGRFYFPMVHLNVRRTIDGFKTFYKSNPELENYDESTHLYSEQVILKNGLEADQNGNEIFIPGGDGDPYFNYIPAVEIPGLDGSVNKGQYVVYPPIFSDNITDELYINGKTEPPLSARDSFYFGFLTCAKNGDFAFRHNSSSTETKSGMHSYVLTTNSDFNYRLRHSTETVNGGPETGGTIQTTKYGNHSGHPADDGEGNIIGPSYKAVAYGQTVVYTFTPNNGYSLKNVYVWDGTGTFPSISDMKNREDVKEIREGDGTDGTYEEHDDNNDGVTDRYTYTFHGIKSNKAIHVVWDQTKLEIQKKTSGSGKDDKDTFLFRMRIQKSDGSSYIDLKNTSDEKAAARFTKMEGNEGWYSFELTNGETFQIPTDLTVIGDKWEVQEIKYPDTDKYGKTLDGWTPSDTEIKNGTFTNGKTDRVTITNNRTKPKPEDDKIVPITVKKVWEDDETLRPKSLTVTIEKAAAIGVEMTHFRNAVLGLGLDKTQITGIRYGTANECRDARNDTKVKVSEAKAEKGSGFVYFWIDPEDPKAIKFYSEKTIYLLNAYDPDNDNNAKGMFEDFYALTDISGLAHVHTDFCESFANLFKNCYALTELHPIAKWNTTNVRSLQKFLQADNPSTKAMTYTDLTPLKKWDTANVDTMRRAFRGAMTLTNIEPIQDWNTGRVIDLREMFERTNVGNNVNKGYFEKWNVTCVWNDNFRNMFSKSSNYGSSTPEESVLPDWGINTQYKREAGTPKWYRGDAKNGKDGTYNPKEGPSTQPDYEPNNPDKFFDNHEKTVLSSTAHDVVKGNWIYTFYVDDDGAEWNVYETIPKAYDSDYTVSASYTNNKEGEDRITSDDTMGVGKKNYPYMGAEPGSTTTLTNHLKPHKLTIKKDLPFVENSEENAQPFEFNIVLTTNEGNPYDISKTDQYKALEESGSISEQSTGKYTLIIKGESSEEFELPAGTRYTVTEDVSKLPDGWRLLHSNNTSGVITQDRVAAFANTNSAKYIVNKVWKGDSYNGVRLPARPTENDKVTITVTAGEQTYTSDPEKLFRDDEADYWAFEFDISKDADVTDVKETLGPAEYYDNKVIGPKDGEPYTVVNTLKEKTLTVKKNTQGDQNGIFDFEVRFWINNSTEKPHPVKIGHSQIFNSEVQHTYDAEFVFEDGITINGKDVAGVFELTKDHEVKGTPLHPKTGSVPTYEDLQKIVSAMNGIDVTRTHQQFKRHHQTNRVLSDFGLKWNGQDTENVYTEQGASVVRAMTTNGRRIDWYIIPTPNIDEEEVINIRTPYGLRTENNDDGKKQLPEGVYGDPDTGTYTFRLRNGESIEFSHLPAGISYDVTEIRKEGWELIERDDNYQGDLNKDETVVFGNGRRMGKLIIQKATKYDVAGTFTFRGVFGRLLDTSKITGTEVTPVYPDGQKETTKYVTEFERHIDSVAYNVEGTTYYVSESGVHTGDNNYLPALDVDYPDSFTLKETVDGKTYAMNYRFIPIKEPDTDQITYKEVKISSATYEFKLDNGGKAVFGGMPFGTTYDVEEIDIPEKWELESLTNDSNGNMHADGFMNVGTAREISEAEPDTISYTFTNKRTGKDVTTEYKTITRYITYTEYTVDGKKVAETVVQPLKIQRTKTVDYDAEPNIPLDFFSMKAAGSDSPKITYSKWTIAEGSAGSVSSPDYPGWTPDIKVVPEWAFNQDDPQDEWVHVIYTTGKGGGKHGSGAKTGDSNNLVLWLGLFAAACAALLSGIIYRIRKNH